MMKITCARVRVGGRPRDEAGTSLARLPPLMSSLLSIVLFHQYFPGAVQPARTHIILLVPVVSIILPEPSASSGPSRRAFAGLLFQLTSGQY